MNMVLLLRRFSLFRSEMTMKNKWRRPKWQRSETYIEIFWMRRRLYEKAKKKKNQSSSSAASLVITPFEYDVFAYDSHRLQTHKYTQHVHGLCADFYEQKMCWDDGTLFFCLCWSDVCWCYFIISSYIVFIVCFISCLSYIFISIRIVLYLSLYFF